MSAATGGGEAPPAAAAADAPAASGSSDPLLQYVILRRDLWGELEWPLGSVVAQGCHAATAALWESRDLAATQEYCAPENLDHMHKLGGRGVGVGHTGGAGGRRRAARRRMLHQAPRLMCTLRGCLARLHAHMLRPLQVVLEIKGEAQLRALAAKLAEAGVPHKLWVEQVGAAAPPQPTAPKMQAGTHAGMQAGRLPTGVHPPCPSADGVRFRPPPPPPPPQPEDFATCLATAPARKSTVAPHVKKLKLCKGT